MSLRPIMHDFYSSYLQECKQLKVRPLIYMKPHDSKSVSVFDIVVDDIKAEEWNPIFYAFQKDNSLQVIAIRCKTLDDFLSYVDTEEKITEQDPICVSLYTSFIMNKLVRSLGNCFRFSHAIRVLEFDGVPLSSENVPVLIEGLRHNKSVKMLTIKHCNLNDDGCYILCNGLKYVLNIELLKLAACNLKSESAKYIANVIKTQQINRQNPNWCFEFPNIGLIGGLQHVVLNNNTEIGDMGINFLLEVIAENSWIRSLVMQQCSLTNKISESVLSTINSNISLEIFDVRANEVSSDTLKSISEILSKRLPHNIDSEFNLYPITTYPVSSELYSYSSIVRKLERLNIIPPLPIYANKGRTILKETNLCFSVQQTQAVPNLYDQTVLSNAKHEVETISNTLNALNQAIPRALRPQAQLTKDITKLDHAIPSTSRDETNPNILEMENTPAITLKPQIQSSSLVKAQKLNKINLNSKKKPNKTAQKRSKTNFQQTTLSANKPVLTFKPKFSFENCNLPDFMIEMIESSNKQAEDTLTQPNDQDDVEDCSGDTFAINQVVEHTLDDTGCHIIFDYFPHPQEEDHIVNVSDNDIDSEVISADENMKNSSDIGSDDNISMILYNIKDHIENVSDNSIDPKVRHTEETEENMKNSSFKHITLNVNKAEDYINIGCDDHITIKMSDEEKSIENNFGNYNISEVNREEESTEYAPPDQAEDYIKSISDVNIAVKVNHTEENIEKSLVDEITLAENKSEDYSYRDCDDQITIKVSNRENHTENNSGDNTTSKVSHLEETKENMEHSSLDQINFNINPPTYYFNKIPNSHIVSKENPAEGHTKSLFEVDIDSEVRSAEENIEDYIDSSFIDDDDDRITVTMNLPKDHLENVCDDDITPEVGYADETEENMKNTSNRDYDQVVLRLNHTQNDSSQPNDQDKVRDGSSDHTTLPINLVEDRNKDGSGDYIISKVKQREECIEYVPHDQSGDHTESISSGKITSKLSPSEDTEKYMEKNFVGQFTLAVNKSENYSIKGSNDRINTIKVSHRKDYIFGDDTTSKVSHLEKEVEENIEISSFDEITFAVNLPENYSNRCSDDHRVLKASLADDKIKNVFNDYIKSEVSTAEKNMKDYFSSSSNDNHITTITNQAEDYTERGSDGDITRIRHAKERVENIEQSFVDQVTLAVNKSYDFSNRGSDDLIIKASHQRDHIEKVSGTDTTSKEEKIKNNSLNEISFVVNLPVEDQIKNVFNDKIESKISSAEENIKDYISNYIEGTYDEDITPKVSHVEETAENKLKSPEDQMFSTVNIYEDYSNRRSELIVFNMQHAEDHIEYVDDIDSKISYAKENVQSSFVDYTSLNKNFDKKNINSGPDDYNAIKVDGTENVSSDIISKGSHVEEKEQNMVNRSIDKITFAVDRGFDYIKCMLDGIINSIEKEADEMIKNGSVNKINSKLDNATDDVNLTNENNGNTLDDYIKSTLNLAEDNIGNALVDNDPGNISSNELNFSENQPVCKITSITDYLGLYDEEL